MLDFLNISKALTDENRLRILMALRNRDLCVCQVTAFLDLAPSTTSKHLSILKQARLIDSTKKGKWVYYNLASGAKNPMIADALRFVLESLKDNPVIVHDEEHIHEILERENLLYAGLNEDEKEQLHSVMIHSLEDE